MDQNNGSLSLGQIALEGLQEPQALTELRQSRVGFAQPQNRETKKQSPKLRFKKNNFFFKDLSVLLLSPFDDTPFGITIHGSVHLFEGAASDAHEELHELGLPLAAVLHQRRLERRAVQHNEMEVCDRLFLLDTRFNFRVP